MKCKVSLDEQLKERYEAWERIYKHGGQDPNWPDGVSIFDLLIV